MKKSWRLFLLHQLTLLLVILNGWQLVALWGELDVIQPLQPVVSPLFRLALAGFWMIAWLILWWLLWRRRPSVRWAIPAAFFLYTMVRLGLISAAESAIYRASWPITAGLGLIAIAFSLWALPLDDAR